MPCHTSQRQDSTSKLPFVHSARCSQGHPISLTLCSVLFRPREGSCLYEAPWPRFLLGDQEETGHIFVCPNKPIYGVVLADMGSMQKRSVFMVLVCWGVCEWVWDRRNGYVGMGLGWPWLFNPHTKTTTLVGVLHLYYGRESKYQYRD